MPDLVSAPASFWLLFLSAALAINISPGPDMLFILSRTIAQGRRVGMASSLGACTGALVHVSAAALGLSVILATSQFAFDLMRFAGAAYLVYLGLRALLARAPDTPATPTAAPEGVTPWRAYRQGVSVDVFNPKAAVFFLAFLPQFVRPALGHVPAQILLLGLLVIAVAMVVEFSIVMMTARATELLRGNPRASRSLECLMGTALVGLGLRLALAPQHAG